MELISREKAIEYATQAHISGCVQQRIVDLLNSVPSIEDMTTDYSAGFDKGYNKGYIDGCADREAFAKDRLKGKWERFDGYNPKVECELRRCSCCKSLKIHVLSIDTYNYCPNCGAEMECEE